MSGFSPVVIPMGKWAIFTCKYGSVNGFNVLLYDMPMGNEGFVVSGWYSIYIYKLMRVNPLVLIS